jgi:stage II sporulation protein D
MSQWGANGAATVGRTWQQILGFYYPGTTLANLGNSPIRIRLDAVGAGTLYLPNAPGLSLGSGGGTPVALPQVTGGGWDGTLWMYPGNGTGGFLPRKAVGAGWNIFSTVLP